MALGRPAPDVWAGVDVGGARKGFHVALVDGEGARGRPVRIESPEAVVEWLRERRPRTVAVDSPRRPAPDGELSREAERRLAGEGVSGIRYTPHAAELERTDYYGWVRLGLDLYAALDAEPAETRCRVIECFPTASLSRWGGRKPRGVSRAAWSTRVLGKLGLKGLPGRMSQDERDAIAAAVTARLHEADGTEAFGDIVVPRATTSRDRLVAEIREHALVLGEVTLSSGRTAQYYVDAKRAILRAAGFLALGELVAAEAARYGARTVGGLTMGADPVACAALAAGGDLSAFLVRKERKAHGLQRWIEGPELDAGELCLIVDDVVTTGESVVTAIERVREEGLAVAAVVCVLDRLAGGRPAIEAAAGAPYVALTTIDEVYPDRPDRAR